MSIIAFGIISDDCGWWQRQPSEVDSHLTDKKARRDDRVGASLGNLLIRWRNESGRSENTRTSTLDVDQWPLKIDKLSNLAFTRVNFIIILGNGRTFA